MSDLPKGWTWVSVAEVAEVAEVQGGIQKQPKRRPDKNRYPFLRVANVLRGHLNLSEVHEIELFDGEPERYILRFGDLLVVEGNGSTEQIGRAAMWREEIRDCTHQNHLWWREPLIAAAPYRYPPGRRAKVLRYRDIPTTGPVVSYTVSLTPRRHDRCRGFQRRDGGYGTRRHAA
jgi:type I restriction enzyme S subunit